MADHHRLTDAVKLLASPSEGERAAAANAINRILAHDKLDIHQLAAAVERGLNGAKPQAPVLGNIEAAMRVARNQGIAVGRAQGYRDGFQDGIKHQAEEEEDEDEKPEKLGWQTFIKHFSNLVSNIMVFAFVVFCVKSCVG